jgi:hypothetical protein
MLLLMLPACRDITPLLLVLLAPLPAVQSGNQHLLLLVQLPACRNCSGCSLLPALPRLRCWWGLHLSSSLASSRIRTRPATVACSTNSTQRNLAALHNLNIAADTAADTTA